MFRLSVIADRGIFASDSEWLAALDRVAQSLLATQDVSLQIRVKGFEPAERARLIERACEVLGGARARAILNGSPGEAARLGFGGAHMPEVAISPRAAGTGSLLAGASVHSLDALRRAVAAEAGYVQFGPVFDAGSKQAAGAGLPALAEIAAASPVPVVAVGGVRPENAGTCIDAGAAAVASVTGVLRAPDPGAAIAAYRAAIAAATSRPVGA